MRLENLKLFNFKNYIETEIKFDGKIICFYGKNGSGKTNILDAIHYLSFTKSYFTNNDQSCIRFNNDSFTIQGLFDMPTGIKEKINVKTSIDSGKKVSRNDKDYQRFSEHIGQFPVVMISPSDSDIINNSSDTRRKYFDSVIAQFDRTYLDSLIRYNKALAQRNKILKILREKNKKDRSQVEIWNQQLVQQANFIFEKRQAYNKLFIDQHQWLHHILSNEKEIAQIEYQSNLSKDSLENILEQHFDDDFNAGFTTKGIHRDDYLFYINDKPAQKFGSQGQQKSFLLALKMAQYMITNHKTKISPILLFDDVFDKLDLTRVEMMIKMVCKEPFGQIFITDTDKDRLKGIIENYTSIQLFNVCNQTVKLEQ